MLGRAQVASCRSALPGGVQRIGSELVRRSREPKPNLGRVVADPKELTDGATLGCCRKNPKGMKVVFVMVLPNY